MIIFSYIGLTLSRQFERYIASLNELCNFRRGNPPVVAPAARGSHGGTAPTTNYTNDLDALYIESSVQYYPYIWFLWVRPVIAK